MNKNSSNEELTKAAKEANYAKLSDLFRMNVYNHSQIDTAFRILLSNYKEDNDKYFNCLKLFIKNANVNYQCNTKGNTTILIEAIDLGLFVPSEKLIKYFKSLDSDNKLNVNQYDNKGDTCLFKLISSHKFKSDDDRYELFNELITESPLIEHCNSNGHTLLSLAFTEGNYFICEELIKKGFDIHYINKLTGDNLVHCAVKGNNCLCVNLIKQCNPDTINCKNNEGLMPIDIAVKAQSCLSGLMTITPISMVNILTEAKNYTQLELLDEYRKKNYIDILKALTVLKQSDQLGNLSLAWNNLLVEYKIEYSMKSGNNNIFTSLYNKVVNFFLNEEINVEYPIILLNNVILKYKLGNYPDIVALYNKYIMKAKKSNSYGHWLWFVSVSFILIEDFMCINKIRIVNYLLKDLTAFLDYQSSSSLVSSEESKSKSNTIIDSYLNANQTLNQNNSLNEVIALFTCYQLSAQGEVNKAKEQLLLFKNTYLYSEAKYPLHNTLKQFYSFLHIKVLYQLNQLEECNGLLNAIALNDTNANFHSKIFYYNSMGILNMKRKKYKYAEFLFRQCDKLIKTEIKKEILIQNLTNYKPCIWYNIGLCYFYSEQYERALKIFLNAKILRKCKPNPCLYYRIGICYLERELKIMKRESFCNSLNDFTVRIEKINNDMDIGNGNSHSNNNNDNDIDNDYDNDNAHVYTKDNAIVGEDNDKNKKKGVRIRDNVKIILRSKTRDNQDENLIEAINYFKETIYLIKEKNTTFTYDLYYTQDKDKNNADENVELLSYEKEVIQSSYLNLLFCLSLLENWTEIIFYCNEYNHNTYALKDIQHILNNFLFEALVNLNNIPQAMELLQSELQSTTTNTNTNKTINIYSKISHTEYSEVDYKIALYFNYIKVSINNNNNNNHKQQINDLIRTLLKLYQYKSNLESNFVSSTKDSKPKQQPDYPPYVISLLIYYLLSNSKIEEAKKLIKYRIIPSFLQ